jgi:hypothetical protein
MPTQCIFCPNPAVLKGGEHIWSTWMNDLFPGEKLFTMQLNDFKNPENSIKREWPGNKFKWQEPVICKKCNNEWMSRIENGPVKSLLINLIFGKEYVPMDATKAQHLAIFIFLKSAILANLTDSCSTVFSREELFLFRETRSIPSNVTMFLSGFAPLGFGFAEALDYGRVGIDKVNFVVCHYGLGHFMTQLVAVKRTGFEKNFRPTAKRFDNLAIKFWPEIMDGFIWPSPSCILNREHLREFTMRWGLLDFTV